MIELTSVSHSFGGVPVLDSVSLQFEEGQTHALVGSSGSGKSTLLKILLGLLDPDKGFVKVGDLVITAETQRQLAKESGYVIQEGGLYPHLTASENVSLAARLQKWGSDKIEDRLNTLCGLVGLEQNLLTRYPHQLSGGQKQRVGLMRALMLNPSLLVFDEPLAALDPLIRSDLQNQLKSIFQELKKTVILVTHDISEAVFFGETVTIMDQGKIIQSGSFRELVQNPVDPFVTRFINAQRPPPELTNA